jgi:hypothetical protein
MRYRLAISDILFIESKNLTKIIGLLTKKIKKKKIHYLPMQDNQKPTDSRFKAPDLELSSASLRASKWKWCLFICMVRVPKI